MKANNHTKISILISNIIIFIMIISSISIIIFYYILNDIKNLKQTNIDENNIITTREILSLKNKIEFKATLSLKEISNKIVEDINNEFDMDKLESDMNKGIYSDKLEDIFRKYIEGVCVIDKLDSNNNNIFICNYNTILADFSKNHSSSYTNRSIDYDISHSINPNMFKNTMDMILKNDTSFYYVEQAKQSTYFSNMISIQDNELQDMISKYGIESLKYINFLIPVYIYDNNDIFGVSDIHNGILIKNNKFIIIQRYNLYQYIKKNSLNSIYTYSTSTKINNLLHIGYIYMIILIILFILLIVYTIIVLNTISYIEDNYTILNNKYLNINNNCNFVGRRYYDKCIHDIFIKNIKE